MAQMTKEKTSSGFSNLDESVRVLLKYICRHGNQTSAHTHAQYAEHHLAWSGASSLSCVCVQRGFISICYKFSPLVGGEESGYSPRRKRRRRKRGWRAAKGMIFCKRPEHRSHYHQRARVSQQRTGGQTTTTTQHTPSMCVCWRQLARSENSESWLHDLSVSWCSLNELLNHNSCND